MISRTIGTKRNYLKHEYLRDSIGYKYHECRSCNVRTQFSCTICGFCWSCHWKIEQLAKIPYYFLADNMTNADNGSILVHQWSAIRKWDLFIRKHIEIFSRLLRAVDLFFIITIPDAFHIVRSNTLPRESLRIEDNNDVVIRKSLLCVILLRTMGCSSLYFAGVNSDFVSFIPY